MVMSACGFRPTEVFTRDRLSLLWRAIEDSHFSYLETEDSPEKLHQRKKLEGFILEYLTLVPHDCKYGLAETSKAFHRTITDTDFSAYRAGLGWAALARYAENLLSQPWRKEYRTIRLYSGYYKHEVEANITGAEGIFTAMGYRAMGNRRLTLNGPICPDTVTAVARDAIIAHCECQLMCQVWERLSACGVRVSWWLIAKERSRGGTADDVARILMGHRPIDVPDSHIYSNVHPLQMKQSYIHHHQLPREYPQTSYYTQEEQIVPYNIYPPYYNSQCVRQANTIPTNGYRQPIVPTALLIDIDRHSSTSDVTLPTLPKSETTPTLHKSQEGMGTYESWDYVFKNLASKDKDRNRQHDRESKTLDRLDRDNRILKQTTLDLEDGLHRLTLERDLEEYRTAKVNESLRKQDEAKRRSKKENGVAIADGLVNSKVPSDKIRLLTKLDVKERKDAIRQSRGEEKRRLKPIVDERAKSKVLNGGHGYSSKAVAPTTSTTNKSDYDTKQLIVSLDETDSREQPKHTNKDKWVCISCTYINRDAANVCEMCSKSREVEIQPLTSGGKQCSVCTLVNGKEARICDACNTPLDDSPTYI